jgi:hypothetical protein
MIHVLPTKVVELVVKITTQPFKPTRVPLQYPLFILVLNTMHWIVLER